LDNSFIFFKDLGRAVVVGLFVLFITTVALSFQSRDKIVICAENEKFTILGRFDSSFDVVFYSASTKNLLTCLGRSIPYFERTIDLVFENSSTIKTYLELNSRYKIVKKTDDKILKIETGKIIVGTDSLVLKNKEKVLILSKSPRSPFFVIELLKKNAVEGLIMPETEEIVYKTILKFFDGNNEKIKIIKNGTNYLVNL